MRQFDVLPDDPTIATTVAALESHGFSVEVVGDLAAARKAVLARVPQGARVWKNTSITLDETGISAAVDAPGGPDDSVRVQLTAQNYASRARPGDGGRRVREHSLALENARAHEAYGQNSHLTTTLEIFGDVPGRIHLVLIRQVSGY